MKSVFLSYSHDNRREAARLRDDLVAAGVSVWWDQEILPGQDWKLAIRIAMKRSAAVILCLSKETQARTTSGIFPEALDAISAHREHAPGSIFLIPVRFSECEIPPLAIDRTLTLDHLQCVDLFPEERRESQLSKLLTALGVAASS